MCGLIFLPFLQACALRELLALRFTSGLTCAARLECNLRFHLDAAASRSGRAKRLCGGSNVHRKQFSGEEFQQKSSVPRRSCSCLIRRLWYFLSDFSCSFFRFWLSENSSCEISQGAQNIHTKNTREHNVLLHASTLLSSPLSYFTHKPHLFSEKGYRPSSSSAARLARGHTSSAHAR